MGLIHSCGRQITKASKKMETNGVGHYVGNRIYRMLTTAMQMSEIK
jgi:hypothetical protein